VLPAAALLLPAVSRQCAHNQWLAIAGRNLRPQAVRPETWACAYAGAGMLVALGVTKPRRVEPTPFGEWCARYPGGKRAILEHARRVFSGYLREDRRGSAFCKTELITKVVGYFGGAVLEPVDYIPRMIIGKQPAYLLVVGRFTHALSKALRADWHLHAPFCYTTGLNAELLGRWYDDAMRDLGHDVAALELDISYFDSGERGCCQCMEQAFYRLYEPPAETAYMLREAMNVVGSTSRGVHYSYAPSTPIQRRVIDVLAARFRVGTADPAAYADLTALLRHVYDQFQADPGGFRESGQPQTTVGNGANDANMEAGLFIYCFANQAPAAIMRMRAAIQGDDNLTLSARAIVEELGKHATQYYAELGFAVKVLVRRDPRLAEFCSGRFWPTPEGTVWGVKPGRAMCKSAWRINPDGSDIPWARGAAISMRHDFGHVPILRALAAVALRDYPHSDAAPIFDQLNRPRAAMRHDVCAATWTLMADLYGVTRSQVEACERLIYSCRGAALLQHPVLDAVVRVDCSVPEFGNPALATPKAPRRLAQRSGPYGPTIGPLDVLEMLATGSGGRWF
jgi:hypothetical protein